MPPGKPDAEQGQDQQRSEHLVLARQGRTARQVYAEGRVGQVLKPADEKKEPEAEGNLEAQEIGESKQRERQVDRQDKLVVEEADRFLEVDGGEEVDIVVYTVPRVDQEGNGETRPHHPVAEEGRQARW